MISFWPNRLLNLFYFEEFCHVYSIADSTSSATFLEIFNFDMIYVSTFCGARLEDVRHLSWQCESCKTMKIKSNDLQLDTTINC